MPDYKYETLLVDQDGPVLTITLNRPEKLNAVDRTMHQELEEVFGEVAFDGSVSAIVVTGSGRGFCSGGDVRSMDERGQSNVLEQRPMGAVSQSGRRILHNMMWVEQPIVCALNGVAAGLGATIALFCDIIYASDQARIGDTHVKAGLVAGDGGAVIWPLLVGVAKRLASGPAMAIRGTKHALNKKVWADLNLALDMGLALEERSSRHDDHHEAARSFVEKRAPEYKGTI